MKYSDQMARTTWTPTTPDHQDTLVALDRLARQHQQVQTNLWKAIRRAYETGIPTPHIAEHSGLARATIWRRISAEQWTVRDTGES